MERGREDRFREACRGEEESGLPLGPGLLWAPQASRPRAECGTYDGLGLRS